MKFEVLRELNQVVREVNYSRSKSPVQLCFPQMFLDGKWSCFVEFTFCEDEDYLKPFLAFVESHKVMWFMSVVNGNLTLHLQ